MVSTRNRMKIRKLLRVQRSFLQQWSNRGSFIESGKTPLDDERLIRLAKGLART
jgi:hypothetical protein